MFNRVGYALCGVPNLIARPARLYFLSYASHVLADGKASPAACKGQGPRTED